MADGGGTRATLELLLHFHGFRNIDLRSRGRYCVEVVAFPASTPGSPGVPFRTYYDASAKKAAARGVVVTVSEGEDDQRGMSCTSQKGLPAYSTSVLPIRFTNEQVQLNEACLFRIHIDSDWLETEVIAIECRLLTRALPENEAPTEEGDTSAHDKSRDDLKEVGKLVLHAKCAAARSGLHRYHPLVFSQPHLCMLDLTMHMALTAVTHPSGPAGLAAAIAANAFPSEDGGGTPVPRSTNSPLRPRTPTGTPSHGRLRQRSASTGRLSAGDKLVTTTPHRPRFVTPGRTRRRTFGSRGRSSSFGASASAVPALPRPRQHRMPLSSAALEAAATAVGLSAALGFSPACLDSDKEGTARAVYQAAELLYSRHALGLRWSKGALEMAKVSATARVATATATAASAAGASKEDSSEKNKGAAKRKGKSKGKRGKDDRNTGDKKAADAEYLAGEGAPDTGSVRSEGEWRAAVGTDNNGAPAASNISSGAKAKPNGHRTRESFEIWGDEGPRAGWKKEQRESLLAGAATAASSTVVPSGDDQGDHSGGGGGGACPPPYKDLAQVQDADAVTEAPSDATPKSDVDDQVDAPSDFSSAASLLAPPPGPPLLMGGSAGGGKAKERRELQGGVRREGRSSKARGGSAGGGPKGKKDRDVVTWTWGNAAGNARPQGPARIQLPSDVRQLSRVIHTRLTEESSACVKAWSTFARATFDGGHRDMIRLREEWVRETARAWSGQCLENVSCDRADLLRLNENLLDPDGFMPLRARAGIRLKRRASPSGGRSRGTTSRRRRNAARGIAVPPPPAAAAAAVVAGDARAKPKLDLANSPASLGALKRTLSTSESSDTSSPGEAEETEGGGAAASSAGGGGGGAQADEEDDDGPPPMLDALERNEDDEALPVVPLTFTPKQQSTSTLSWGNVSPWGSAATGGGGGGGGSSGGGGSGRSEQGWLLRLASGGGSAASSPTGSSSGRGREGSGVSPPRPAASAAAAAAAAKHALMVAHFPPPPQSLLPVFDRELHGFDPCAPEDERWGDLPFLVVESWGRHHGVPAPAGRTSGPGSPVHGTDEYRLFQEIAWTSTDPRQASPSRRPPLTPSGASTGPVPIDEISSASGNDWPFGDEPAPTEETPPKALQGRSAQSGSVRIRSSRVNTDASGSSRPALLMRSSSAPVDPSAGPGSARGSGGRAGSPGSEARSIWDQPASPWRSRRAAKPQAARRPRASLPPSGPLNGNVAGTTGGSVVGDERRHQHHRRKSSEGLLSRTSSTGSMAGSLTSSDDVWSGSDNFSSGDERKLSEETRSRLVRKIATRNEMQRRKMWGRRPSWTSALLAPVASSASGAGGSGAAVGGGGGDKAGASGMQALRTESGKNHLIVLVHGLGGRPADMALMRGYLQTLMPGAELMVATSLQDMRKDNLGVEDMGRKLAEDVHAHIARFCPYLGSPAVPAPSSAPPTSAAGSLPLSPVTPLRPPRTGGLPAGTPGEEDSSSGGGVVQPSPVRMTRGVHASPGSAATARAISDELAKVTVSATGTPARRIRRRAGAGSDGSGASGGGSGGGAGSHSRGMISFVCFSMGGLVARSALLEPAMVPYLTSLQCFVTLACPHLGQTSTPLSFFKTGAWAVRKLTGLRVLHELDLDDAEDPRETTLYRLSLSPGLERFRTIVFAANPRDGFVPLHSATVRSPPSKSGGGGGSGSTGKNATVSNEMAHMLMSKVDERSNRVVRITLDAPRGRQAQGALDTVIGRAGHMCFIDSPQVAWLISLALLPFLEESRK